MGKENNSTVNIQFTEKALRFIKAVNVKNPSLLVNLGYKTGGGGCGGGGSSYPIPYAKVMAIDGGNPVAGGFVRVETTAGLPVYLAKPLWQLAERDGSPLVFDLKGVLFQKLKLDGLDLTPLAEKAHRRENGCH